MGQHSLAATQLSQICNVGGGGDTNHSQIITCGTKDKAVSQQVCVANTSRLECQLAVPTLVQIVLHLRGS